MKSSVDDIGALVIGEAITINGHIVIRVGVCGPAAYTVDGEHLPLELAELFAVTPLPRAEPAPAPRKPAVVKVEPELLVETRAALPKLRGVSFEHRSFAGGEAVIVKPAAGASPDLRAALAALLSSGLHAEWGAGGGSIVVAWSKAALAPVPKKKTITRGAARAVA